MKKAKPAPKPSPFASLAFESAVGRRLARLRQQPELKRGKTGG